jgi:hypothetical protein
VVAQAFLFVFRIGEISCPTRYEEDSSSINFARSLTYGLGVLRVSFQYAFAKLGIFRSRIFVPDEVATTSEKSSSLKNANIA